MFEPAADWALVGMLAPSVGPAAVPSVGQIGLLLHCCSLLVDPPSEKWTAWQLDRKSVEWLAPSALAVYRDPRVAETVGFPFYHLEQQVAAQQAVVLLVGDSRRHQQHDHGGTTGVETEQHQLLGRRLRRSCTETCCL